MNDWRITSQTEPYRNALIVTESLEEPAIGFVRPTGTQKSTTAILKQNNTIIQLLVNISKDLSDCKEAIQDIKRVVAEKSAGTSLDILKALDDLQKGFQKLSLDEPIKPKVKKASFYVFKDLLKIFEEEKRKASSSK